MSLKDKVCVNCQYSKKEMVQVAPGQGALVPFCTHDDCCDPVTGDPMPCNQVRQIADMCGLMGKRYKKKEEEKKPNESVIVPIN